MKRYKPLFEDNQLKLPGMDKVEQDVDKLTGVSKNLDTIDTTVKDLKKQVPQLVKDVKNLKTPPKKDINPVPVGAKPPKREPGIKRMPVDLKKSGNNKYSAKVTIDDKDLS